MALEPFQVEPSLDPDQQYLVKRAQTKELDSAIGDVEEQIQNLEVRKGMALGRGGVSVVSKKWVYLRPLGECGQTDFCEIRLRILAPPICSVR